MTEKATGWWGLGRPVIDPSRSWSPRFAALVQLMLYGPGGEDRLSGEVRARIDQPVMDFEYRIRRRGELVRCETLDGRIHFIAGRTTAWAHDPNSSELVVRPRTGRFNPALDDLEFGAARPTDDRWDGDDFTIPTGAEVAVTFLDRPAWLVELAPPPHKPYPMQMIIDRATGLELRRGNESFGTFHEWSRLDLDADLPDHLFGFDPATDTLAEPLSS